MDYDVFNGDADGIISLVQLRLSEPRVSELVTGRKRDIKLLDRVSTEPGDRITVLDISMRTNLTDLQRLLDEGASVLYFDHHNAGEGVDHPNLKAHINTAGEICTAVLVDQYLDGAHRAWAVTASYGDNFPAMAERLAKGHDFPLEALKTLGEMVNYNGYGASEADLHFYPADLYREMSGYATPMAFLDEKPQVIEKLTQGYADDFRMAEGSKTLVSYETGEIRVLPDAAASRRISGMFGNQLAQENPDRAHAILTEQEGGFLVSIRAPISTRQGADVLAIQFETGGGRAAAAGINHLQTCEVDRFLEAFRKAFK
jgi:nanoRNase/pAp phosphatase (c-di-AMP/oligoRNAs hydrolase)